MTVREMVFLSPKIYLIVLAERTERLQKSRNPANPEVEVEVRLLLKVQSPPIAEVRVKRGNQFAPNRRTRGGESEMTLGVDDIILDPERGSIAGQPLVVEVDQDPGVDPTTVTNTTGGVLLTETLGVINITTGIVQEADLGRTNVPLTNTEKC